MILETDPTRAFVFAFFAISPETATPYWFKPGDALYARWKPCIEWGLNYARALTGRGRNVVRDTAEAMSVRPFPDAETYPPGHIERFVTGVSAMIQAAQRARAAEQKRAA